MELNEGQKKGLEILKSGKNVFLTGYAGTGKSFLIKQFTNWCNLEHKKCYTTSTTGVSALLINGTTLHSWAGVGLGEDTKNVLLERVKRSKAFIRWKCCKVLIIDEVSMLSITLFEKLDYIGKQIRQNRKVFGGIQLVLTGDFCQLPPIGSDFVFKSLLWEVCVDNIIYLNENMRQTDSIFKEILPEIRLGRVTDEIIKIIEERIGKSIKTPEGILPTKLYSHRASVEKINKDSLKSLINKDNKIVKFHSKDSIKSLSRLYMDDESQHLKRIDKMCNTPAIIELAIGAQVMCTFNIDLDSGLANGSRGVVIGFLNNLPKVRFMNGLEIIIDKNSWEMKLGEDIIGIRNQIPLILAYAVTIHKSQGSTLDCAIIDLGQTVFEYGQAYTALSRCKSLDCISIVTLDPNKLVCSPHVKEFYENIKETSLETTGIPKETCNDLLCCICAENEKNIAIVPCGHICVCLSCGYDLNICPICRKNVSQVVKIYF